MTTHVLVATEAAVLRVVGGEATATPSKGLGDARPTNLAADPHVHDRAWCSTREHGVFRSDDAGDTWTPVGLAEQSLMTVVASPARKDLVWAGAEPSAVWRSDDAGATWRAAHGLLDLPSAPTWAFPPRPETHHVRWIAPHPQEPDRLWVAIEAGALVRTHDGGRTWHDRVPGGPYDTHEAAVHAEAPSRVRIAAGDGYFETPDGGDTWSSPMTGLTVSYLRSVAIDPGDPETVLVSGASGPRTAYVTGRSDGRLYRRRGDGSWVRVTDGWPERPSTIAPLLVPGRRAGELWAADERGVHRSEDGGAHWVRIARLPRLPNHLRGLAVVA